MAKGKITLLPKGALDKEIAKSKRKIKTEMKKLGIKQKKINQFFRGKR